MSITITKSMLVEITANYYESSANAREDVNEMLEMLDNDHNFLYDDRYYNMDELDVFLNGSVFEILNEINFEKFRLNDNFFRFTIHGIESTDRKDYSDNIDGDTIDLLSDYYRELRCNTWYYDTYELIELYEMYDRQETTGDPFFDDELVEFITQYYGEIKKVA